MKVKKEKHLYCLTCWFTPINANLWNKSEKWWSQHYLNQIKSYLYIGSLNCHFFWLKQKQLQSKHNNSCGEKSWTLLEDGEREKVFKVLLLNGSNAANLLAAHTWSHDRVRSPSICFAVQHVSFECRAVEARRKYDTTTSEKDQVH